MASSSALIRLAILEADTPLPGTIAKFKSYGGVFTDLFSRATAPEPVESALTISAYDVVTKQEYPNLDDVDAILITGSKHSAYLNDEWIVKLTEFTQKAIATEGRVKVVGICFGHQIVGRALGIPVDRNDKGWEVSVTEIKLTEHGRELFGGETLKIHQMHRDIIFSHPAGAVALAETDLCATQGMLIPGKVITVQGHPEFTESIVSEILDSRRGTVIEEHVYSSGMDRVKNEHDGVQIAQTFLRFFRGQEKA